MDLSGGYSGASGSSFRGVHSILAGTRPHAKGAPEDPKNLSVLLDVSVYSGSENGEDQKLFGTMAGGRWTFAKDPDQMATVSVHSLIGAMHTGGGPTVLSFATGGSVDLMMGSSNSSKAGWGVRFLVDYVTRKGDAHNLTRASVELVKRWGYHH